MKKILPLILILLLLSACGEAAEAEATPTPTQAPAYTFKTDSYPAVMGGAALEPLGDSLSAVMLGKNREEVAGLGSFGSTAMAYTALADGSCGLVLAMEGATPPGLELETARIADDALVFYVSASNPVSSLTTAQLQKIYSGAVTGWGELGGDDVPVTAFRHAASSGTELAMDELVMQGQTMAEGPIDYFPDGAGGFIEAVAGFDGSEGAIGFTTYYYAVTMGMAEDYKILAIDGVTPGADTIEDGSYPFIVAYNAAIRADAAQGSGERLLWEWLQCDAGQSLVAYCGYCAVRTGGAK